MAQLQTLEKKQETTVVDRVQARKLAIERAINEHMVCTEDILAIDTTEYERFYEITIYLRGPVAVLAKIPKDGGEVYSEIIELR